MTVTRIPITKSHVLQHLDDKECIEGYMDGRENSPSPGGNRSFSYWHGWRNGMVDGNHAKTDDAQMKLARDVIETGYLRNLQAPTEKE